MIVFHIQVHVKPESIDDFKTATIANARESAKEPGIARFDFLQNSEDPARFVLVEAYRTPEAALAHKETIHYQAWRDTVAGMMAEPRSGVKYSPIFPPNLGDIAHGRAL